MGAGCHGRHVLTGEVIDPATVPEDITGNSLHRVGAPEDPHLVLKEHDTDGRIALRAPEERTTKALWAAQERPVPWSAAVHGGLLREPAATPRELHEHRPQRPLPLRGDMAMVTGRRGDLLVP